MKLRPLQEQVVVVMGASSGIGRETALEFATRGARVVLSARGEEGLDTLADAIRGFGGEALVVPADVTDPEQMQKVANEASEHFGRLDTWVQIASVSLYARFEDTRPEEFEQVVRTNLLGTVHGAQAALPELRNGGGGALICVSSVEAVRALPYQSAYAAGKHGVDAVLEALRVELQQEGVPIAVTQILPSAMDTPLFEHARTRIGVRPKGMPPVYDPRLVARAIVHAAEHPTRQLVVGGGGRLLAALEVTAPRVVDGFLRLTGFRSQRTGIAKTASASDNLEAPLDRDHSVEGGVGSKGRSWSIYTSWSLSPWRGPITIAAAVASGILLATRVASRQERTWRKRAGPTGTAESYAEYYGAPQTGRTGRFTNPYDEDAELRAEGASPRP